MNVPSVLPPEERTLCPVNPFVSGPDAWSAPVSPRRAEADGPAPATGQRNDPRARRPDSAIGGLHRRRRIAASGLDRRLERVGRDLRRRHHCHPFGVLIHSDFGG